MSERAGRLLVGGRLVPGRVRFENGRIVAVEAEPALERLGDLPIVAPGLVDIHVHGYGGADPLDEVETMATALARAGTTSFLPTLFPDEPARLGATAERLWSRVEGGAIPAGAARCLGVHLEGPFLNPLAAGALPAERFAEPSPTRLEAILGPASGGGRGVRAMTLAPELSGASELVAELARAGIRASLGHSLASVSEGRAAERRGARGVTHLFNAMSGFHHRHAGLPGLALTSEEIVAELIGDLVHVGTEAVEVALAARGPAGIALISDALAGAGSRGPAGSAAGPEGPGFRYHGVECVLCEGAFWVGRNGVPTEPPRLAGAAKSQLEAAAGLVRAGVASAEDALTMASETPARALGLEDEVGRLAVGARADLLLLSEPDLGIVEVLIGGADVAPAKTVPGR